MRRLNPLLAPALALLLSACAANQKYEEITKDEALRQTMLRDHVDTGPGLFKDLFGSRSDEEQEQKLSEAEQRIARLEQQLQRELIALEQRQPTQAATPVRHEGLLPKMGLIVDGAVDPQLNRQLELAFRQAAATFPFAPVASATVQTQLQAYQCQTPADAQCAAQLATYPGLRLLALLQALGLDGNGKLRMRATLVDTVMSQSYALPELLLPTVDGQTAQASIQAAVDSLVLQALDKSRLAPWSTRAFSREGDTWFLAAGEQSGLKVGDVLEIRQPGRVVKAPNGTAAGWIPGATKGAVRVKGLFGDDLAAAELIEGSAPTADDVLLPRR